MDFTKITEALEKKGYQVQCFKTKELAAEYLNTEIDGKTVGIGGSETVRQMGLYPMLAAHNTVYWHAEKPDNMTVMETRKAACKSEIYISSVNGISEDGTIVNIDNTGNRTSAISFGADTIYLVIGENKIAPDYDAALHRARNIAAPRNAQRLKVKTPCAVKGDRCYDCNSPARICRNLSVLWNKPTGAVYKIILICEELEY